MGPDFDQGFALIRSGLVSAVSRGQRDAAGDAAAYVPAVLAESGQADVQIAEVIPDAFSGVAEDGRPLSSLMYQPVIASKVAVKNGHSTAQALKIGRGTLDRIVMSEINAAGSWSSQAAITSRPNVTGYVRMISPGACKDCVILAGKWYRWNAGFERHKYCMCRHIPAAENISGDVMTDPYAYFNSLSKAEQDALLGEVGAQTVRDGGDIYRVVNIQNRGLAGKAGKFNTPTKMTPEQIYGQGLTREQTIQALREHGYITGPQVGGGNLLGPYHEAYSGMTSVPRAGSARERVLNARETGVRDPLDRATMTAAERRLFDAQYQLMYAEKHGVLPTSIGPNSADFAANSLGRPASPADMARLERLVQTELGKIKPGDKSLLTLAESLGMREDKFAEQQIFNNVEQKMMDQFLQSTRLR